MGLVPLQLVQRRLREVDVAGLDQRPHEPEQQGQQQRADVLAVDVGVGHQHDLVVAQLRHVEVVVDAGAEGGDQRLHLGVLQHPVDPRLLDVDDLAADRQDRLVHRVAAALGRAAGAVTLDDVELALFRVGRLAVGQLAGQRPTRAGPCAGRGRAPCGPRSGPARPTPALVMIVLASGGLRSNQWPSQSLHAFCTNDLASVLPSLVLVWPSNCGCASLTETIAASPSRMSSPVRLSSLSLRIFWSARVLVDHGGQRRPEALLVGAALVRVDRVGERVDRLGVGVFHCIATSTAHALSVPSVVEVDDRLVVGVLGGVEVLDEVLDAALVVSRSRRPRLRRPRVLAARPPPSRSSRNMMDRPRLRKAISCSRRESVSKE